jgi:hypothetical protein
MMEALANLNTGHSHTIELKAGGALMRGFERTRNAYKTLFCKKENKPICDLFS